MTDQVPERPARDEGDEDPAEFTGELVDDGLNLDVGSFEEEE